MLPAVAVVTGKFKLPSRLMVAAEKFPLVSRLAIVLGVSALVAVVLGLGAYRLMRMKVLVRRLSAQETLGSIDLIVTDKTGTLTENKLALTAIRTPEGVVEDSGTVVELATLAAGAEARGGQGPEHTDGQGLAEEAHRPEHAGGDPQLGSRHGSHHGGGVG